MAYKFNDRFCFIEIEDNKFHIPLGKRTGENIRKSRDTIAEMKADEKNFTDEKKACAAVDSAIDSILGDKASEKIFDGRGTVLFERLDVLIYVYSEITKYANRIAGELNVSPETEDH